MSFAITHNCSGCARCVTHCPVDAIAGRRGELHRVRADRCIDCGACGVVCPDGAVLDERGERFALGAYLEAWPRVQIDPRRCTGCGDCVAACSYDALYRRAATHASGPVPSELAGRCVGCGGCELVCAPGALEIQGRGWRVRA